MNVVSVETHCLTNHCLSAISATNSTMYLLKNNFMAEDILVNGEEAKVEPIEEPEDCECPECSDSVSELKVLNTDLVVNALDLLEAGVFSKEEVRDLFMTW